MRATHICWNDHSLVVWLFSRTITVCSPTRSLNPWSLKYWNFVQICYNRHKISSMDLSSYPIRNWLVTTITIMQLLQILECFNARSVLYHEWFSTKWDNDYFLTLYFFEKTFVKKTTVCPLAVMEIHIKATLVFILTLVRKQSSVI